MLPPLTVPANVPGPLSAVAGRVTGQGQRIPAVEPGQDPRARAADATADDRRRVPPPPRGEPTPAERALRGDRADAADPRLSRRDGATGRSNPFQGSSEAFRRPIFTRPPGVFDAAADASDIGRRRPRPSSAFLAQIIGQDVAGRLGAVGRNPENATQLYRRTEAVTERERQRAEGVVLPLPSDRV
ncbi:MAG: hypothetical protein HQ481_08155 [Alphaproteobacteria bacterium]|nr:hypothetical protein [Alphaproteobacteria bacterium]